MRKLLSLILCVVISAALLFCLAGCGSDSGSSPTVSATEAPSPSPTPSPSPSPSPQPPALEEYSSENFTVKIPVGWQVRERVVDAGGGTMRLVVSITDPDDGNNSFFFTTALEPFFPSVDDKNLCIPYLPEQFDWSPVIDAPTAEATLSNWATMYTFMQAEGMGLNEYFGNYLMKDVLDSYISGDSSDTDSHSSVLATVGIQGTRANYVMYFENRLIAQDTEGIFPSGSSYFISFYVLYE